MGVVATEMVLKPRVGLWALHCPSSLYVQVGKLSLTCLEDKKESNQWFKETIFYLPPIVTNPCSSRASYKSENGPERKLAQVLISLSQNTEMAPL